MEYLRAEESMVSRNRILKKSEKIIPHYHDIHELYYMLEGKTTYFIDNEIYNVEKGDFVFIPKGSIHATDYEKGKNERLLVCFEDEYFEGKAEKLREQIMPLRVISIPQEQSSVIESLLLKIEEEYRLQENGKELLLELYIKELLVLICRYRYERKSNVCAADKIIYDISEYIKNYFNEDITLASLSKTFAVSESYLSRKFKAVAGVGVNQYITIVRINNGVRLLRESKLTIMEVAQKCGFNDSNYFAAVFKKMKGVTPLNYRKQRMNV